eukprot:CAMPEP_0175634222 /NCGR_PEP_ID=MMETSP0097-20121207/1058_1 /TAXON_ID=311494 /ORGANISM="Alexandrium monilatum, Strain CCMP3105" /LENGTH=414 /DNA_ID=CAMNT_0016939809 /DNA_START=5 /DNA_END=1250 /DNA_ORIENTATION=+
MTKPRSGRGSTKPSPNNAEHAAEKYTAEKMKLFDSASGAQGARRRRRAARFAAETVEPPPGLEAIASRLPEEAGQDARVEAPPGFEGVAKVDAALAAERQEDVNEERPTCEEVLPCSKDAGAKEERLAACRVAVGGLPNGILSEPMMLAMLQQAGLEGDVVNFSTEEGQPCGEARIAFLSFQAALRCVRHVEGCHWDPSGAEVTASVEPPLEEMAGQLWDAGTAVMQLGGPLEGMPEEAGSDAMVMMEPPEESHPTSNNGLRAEARMFEPVEAPAFKSVESNPAAVRLRAEAPAFKSVESNPAAVRLRAEAPTFEPADLNAAIKHLRAEAPLFEPLGLELPAEEPQHVQLSADAPAFVPFGEAPAKVFLTEPADEARAVAQAAATGAKLGISSDTSTEMGDSDGEDSFVPKSDA